MKKENNHNKKHFTMKKLFLLLFLVTAMSCTKDNNGKLNPNAMISIWPKGAVQTTKAKDFHLSNLEIVKQTFNLSFYNENMGSGNLVRGFAPAQRDTVNIRLLMWGTDIIGQFGDYVTEFIDGHDFVLRRNLATPPATPIYDTIAYISNNVILNARNRIKSAYDSGNYTAVYAAFDSVFTFIPITGAEWRELKTQNKN